VAGRSRLGKTERFWFDAVTGLVRYVEVWQEGPEGLRVPAVSSVSRDTSSTTIVPSAA
jgi:hypothetical protein